MGRLAASADGRQHFRAVDPGYGMAIAISDFDASAWIEGLASRSYHRGNPAAGLGHGVSEAGGFQFFFAEDRSALVARPLIVGQHHPLTHSDCAGFWC